MSSEGDNNVAMCVRSYSAIMSALWKRRRERKVFSKYEENNV
jgi:hypothetical protein